MLESVLSLFFFKGLFSFCLFLPNYIKLWTDFDISEWSVCQKMKLHRNKHGSRKKYIKKKNNNRYYIAVSARTRTQQTTEAPIKGRLKEKGREYLLALTYGSQ